MAQITTSGIQIEYETSGDVKDNALILVRDLGTQLIDWPEEYVAALVQQGFYVVLFDNRDAGLSEKMDDCPIPNSAEVIADLSVGQEPDIPYTIDDMAADIIGLMDALEIEEAHICGLSMGGIIVQAMAAKYGERCISLTTINAGSGAPDLPRPKLELFAALMRTTDSEDPAAILKQRVLRGKLTTGTQYPVPENVILEREKRALERCMYRAGRERQHAALVASGDRSERLRSINVPTLIIHGTEDPLVHYSAGFDTVRKIPHARLELIEGMGHDLPEEVVPELARIISEHAELALCI